jgi:formylglycine-generating enzyme required for sulfatase activity
MEKRCLLLPKGNTCDPGDLKMSNFTGNNKDSLDNIGTSLDAAVNADMFASGSLFAGRFEIVGEGKRGGMGVVYKCRDIRLNNRVMGLKVIHARLLESAQARVRFTQEVAICQELGHPGIIRVYDIGEWEGIDYFTMEWVEGASLRELITTRKERNAPFELEEARTIINQLCDALTHAHEKTIHRDIKPENILIVGNGHGMKVKLADFGIAKMLNPSQFTSTSVQMGTPYYMAPEQEVDAGRIDKRADIYSLGVVLFELLTLERPTGFELPSEINGSLPKTIDDVIRKALTRRAENRYGDARGFADALKNVGSTKGEDEVKKKYADDVKKKAEEDDRKRREEAERQAQEDARRKAERQRLEIEEKARQERFAVEQEEETRKKAETERKKQEEEARRRAELLVCPVTGIEFVEVPGGDFDMGDLWGDGFQNEKPVHNVRIRPFLMGKCLVTDAQWEMVMGKRGTWRYNGSNFPVFNPTWRECQKFINALNRKSGRSYRLPSEAEWEYAARSGGKRQKWAGTDSKDNVDAYVWHYHNSHSKLPRVGEKLPNGLGLFDMSGLLWEWCQDIWHDNYDNAPSDGSAWEQGGNEFLRVLRGGSYRRYPEYTTTSGRVSAKSDSSLSDTGFRLALTEDDVVAPQKADNRLGKSTLFEKVLNILRW